MRQGWAVRDLIRLGLEELPVGSWVGFLTITEGPDARGLAEHGEAVGRFLGDLRRLFGAKRASDHDYIGVRELQKRGAWHTHLLVAHWKRVEWGEIRRLLVKHGLGEVFYVKTFQVRPDAVEGLARYLAKSFGAYFTKSANEAESWKRVVGAMPVGQQLVVKSRGWAGGRSRTSIERERLQAYRARMLAGVVEWRDVPAHEPLGVAISGALERLGVLAVDDPVPKPDPVPKQGVMW